MIGSAKAVFLSYASQDADAARRGCHSLRAAGIEVWFDQSDLRGGDAWDAAIRKQVKDCRRPRERRFEGQRQSYPDHGLGLERSQFGSECCKSVSQFGLVGFKCGQQSLLVREGVAQRVAARSLGGRHQERLRLW
jgi:hypothetical protein